MKRSTSEAAPSAYVEPKPKSRVTVRLHKGHGKYMPAVKVGAKHKMSVTGKVTGMSSDEYGHSIDMDMDSLSHDTDGDQETNEVGTPLNQTQAEPASLSAAMKAMHARRRGRK